MRNYLTELLFPHPCLLCGQSLVRNELCICNHCLHKLPRTRFHLHPGNLAEQLFYGKTEIESCACFCYFRKGEPFREAIHQFKYHNSPRTAYRLGMLFGRELMADNWQRPIDALLPVPLHWLKQIRRGYNQSEWIARGLSNIWHIPIRTDLLRRRRNTATQTQKNIYERFLNASEAFEIRKNMSLSSHHILLIDDVLTSGSTLCACAEALHAAADLKISILTLGFAE